MTKDLGGGGGEWGEEVNKPRGQLLERPVKKDPKYRSLECLGTKPEEPDPREGRNLGTGHPKANS